MKKVIIYGGSVGALVLTKELLKNKDLNVILINPSKSWGGYFGGLKINDTSFDIGMNLFEFTSFISESDSILDYNPHIKSITGKFSNIIENYIKDHISTRLVDTPEVYYNGKFSSDYYISNSLELFSNLEIENKVKLIEELQDIVSEKNALHASNKNINPNLFYQESYEKASKLNHGLTFHTLFIEPFIQKILNINSNSFPAILHRIPWAPLYYPETLLSSLEGNISETFLVSKFEYPQNESFSIIINKLYDYISSQNNIKILNDKVINIDCSENLIQLETGSSFNYDELVLSLDITDCYKILGNNDTKVEFKKASFIFLFIRLPKDDIKKDFSVLFILDSKIPFYRITNQTNLKNNTNEKYVDLIIEFNADYLEKILGLDFDLRVSVESILFEMDLLFSFNPEIFDIKRFNNAINLPTFDNVELYTKIKSQIILKDNINFIGNVNNFFANSFNDNLIQALLISKKINHDN